VKPTYSGSSDRRSRYISTLLQSAPDNVEFTEMDPIVASYSASTDFTPCAYDMITMLFYRNNQLSCMRRSDKHGRMTYYDCSEEKEQPKMKWEVYKFPNQRSSLWDLVGSLKVAKEVHPYHVDYGYSYCSRLSASCDM
jgi:hypothetical protein